MTTNNKQKEGQRGGSRIIVGDCLDSLKTLEPNSVDLICTDPPY